MSFRPNCAITARGVEGAAPYDAVLGMWWGLCAACRNGTMANGIEYVRCGTSFLHAQKGGKEASEDPFDGSPEPLRNDTKGQ